MTFLSAEYGFVETQDKDLKSINGHCDAKANSTHATPDTANIGSINHTSQNEATHGPRDASTPITDERSKEKNNIHSATKPASPNTHHSANTKDGVNISMCGSLDDSHPESRLSDVGSGGELMKNGVAEHQEAFSGGLNGQDVNMEDPVVNEIGGVHQFIDFSYLVAHLSFR